MSQNQEYYQPASMVIKNISFTYNNSDVWYWVERANLGKIYNVALYDSCAVVHFSYNHINEMNDLIRENHRKLEEGQKIKIFNDQEKKNYWFAKKYIDETSLFDEESVTVNEDFQEELLPNVTDNRLERLSNSLFSNFNLYYPATPVINNTSYAIDIESQYDIV